MRIRSIPESSWSRVLLIATLLVLSASTARAETFNACSGAYPVFDATLHEKSGLCWEPCKLGYEGKGPFCTGTQCPAGAERSLGFCYETCRSGYEGAGPVCAKACPSTFTDVKLTCVKPKPYGRGAGYGWRIGDSLKSLSGAKKRCEKKEKRDCEKNGLLYYPTCKSGYGAVGCCTCSPSCPSGMKDLGAACNKDMYTREAKSVIYTRAGGQLPPKCTSVDIQKPCSAGKTTAPFYLVISSDPQIVWNSWAGCSAPAGDPNRCNLGDYCFKDAGACKNKCGSPPTAHKCMEDNSSGACARDDACNATRAFETNRNQLAAINAIQTLTGNTSPQGVIINGDLTSYFHPQEAEWFLHYVSSLKWPVFPGLGNHDYSNNWNGASWHIPGDGMQGVKQALNFMRSTVSCGRLAGFPSAKVHGYDRHSMAYSWDIGSYHFVQLHNRPNYPSKDDKAAGTDLFGPSLGWLARDVAAATQAGKDIILNMHDFGDNFSQTDPTFIAAIKNSNVRAIFAGHLHGHFGRHGQVSVTPDRGAKRNIPYYFSGSSLYMKFLLVRFDPAARGGFSVSVIDSSTGAPRETNHDRPGGKKTDDPLAEAN